MEIYRAHMYCRWLAMADNESQPRAVEETGIVSQARRYCDLRRVLKVASTKMKAPRQQSKTLQRTILSYMTQLDLDTLKASDKDTLSRIAKTKTVALSWVTLREALLYRAGGNAQAADSELAQIKAALPTKDSVSLRWTCKEKPAVID